MSCLWVDDVVVDRGLVIPYLNFSGLDDVLISIDVGSGDCFNGALASMINKGEDILNSINFAQRAAAFSTTKKGASQSFPFLNEIK